MYLSMNFQDLMNRHLLNILTPFSSFHLMLIQELQVCGRRRGTTCTIVSELWRSLAFSFCLNIAVYMVGDFGKLAEMQILIPGQKVDCPSFKFPAEPHTSKKDAFSINPLGHENKYLTCKMVKCMIGLLVVLLVPSLVHRLFFFFFLICPT